MPNLPKITVIMSVYNSSKTLERAYKSVIAQSYENIEFIMVDDCSTDNSVEVAKKLIAKGTNGKQVRLLRNKKNSGTFVSRNYALTKATGEYFCFHDSDDESHRNYISKLYSALTTNSSAKIAVCKTNSRRKRMNSLVICAVSTMFHKSLINEIGYFDSVRFAADSEFRMRCQAVFGKNSIFVLGENLMKTYESKTSLTGRSDIGFTSEPRRRYVSEFRRWHRRTRDKNSLKIPFPLSTRRFPVHNKSLIGHEVNSSGNYEITLHNKTEKPLVSVIVCTHNTPSEKLNRAVNSLVRQDYENIQIIVVDDCSKQPAALSAKDHRIKLYRTSTNYGPYICRNHAIKNYARGKYITFLDSDDWCEPGYITSLYSDHVRSGCVVSYSKHVRHWSSGEKQKSNMIHHASSFYEKALHEKIGFFDSVRFAADWEFRRRIERVYGEASVNRVESHLYHYEYLMSPNALTNKYKNGGEPRVIYSDNLEEWHESCNGLSFVDFPMEQRPFNAPPEMIPKKYNKNTFFKSGKPDLSICVPIKNRTHVVTPSGKKLNLFEKQIDSLISASKLLSIDVELVVVDFESEDVDMKSFLDEKLSGIISYKLVSVTGMWSLSQARNIAAASSDADILFFSDADMRFDDGKVIEDAYKFVSEGYAFFPVCWSEANRKDPDIVKRLKWKGLPRDASGWFRDEGYGLLALSKQDFYKTGGYTHLYKWGKEDDYIHSKVKEIKKIKRGKYKTFVHQWHPHSIEWKNRNYSKKDS